MKLNRTGNPLDRETRNKDNENWAAIEDGFKDVGNDISRIDSRVDNFVEEVSNEALGKVVDNAKLNWKEPVDNFSDLPSIAEEGDTRMVRYTDENKNVSGKVYRYDGENWIEIQQIDAGPVNELDSRLTQQLADTNKQLEGLEVNVSTVGVYPNTDVDYTEELRGLIATGVIPVFPAGRYKITDELLFKHGQAIRTVGKVILDGSEFVGTKGNSIIKAVNDGADHEALPPLTHDVVIGENRLTFSATHNLKAGDVVCLYDNTQFSWSAERAYYKKGEFCRISSVVSTTEVVLENAFFDNYDATTNVNFGVYKMNMGSFNIYGNLEVIQGKKGNFYGIILNRVKDFVGDNIVCIAKNGSYTAAQLNQCFNADFRATCIQESLSGLGGDYGLSISNCQHINARGYFVASRHGVAHGGFDGVGAIVNRDCNIEGVVKTNGLGSTHAFDCHGNTEHVSFNGTIYGGVGNSGNHLKVRGTIYAEKQGTCVRLSHMSGINVDFSETKMISYHDPKSISRGVFDFGGSGTSETNGMEGGTVKLNNVEIYAPSAGYGFVFRTRNTNFDTSQKIDIDMSNIKITTNTGVSSLAIWVAKVGESIGVRLLNLSNAVVLSDTPIVVGTYAVEKQLGSITNLKNPA